MSQNITLTHDREISISVGNSRKSIDWKSESTTLSQFYGRLQYPVRGVETIADYLKLPKADQDARKDIGGFVGGTLNGPRRKAENVLTRSIISLDADSLPAHSDEILRQKLDNLGCGYVVYSTRKHRPEAPRLRISIPLARDVTPDEYGAISRRMAQQVGMAWMDPTTFEPARLMYWPSCCSDSEYQFYYRDAPLLEPDIVLMSYAILGGDWRDVSQWPKHPSENRLTAHGATQKDPRTKNGAIGVFCALYPMERVFDELLPDTYDPVDNDPNRYTYRKGSTTGGAIVYDDGLFLFSHHATDPCSERLVNAFDLLRLHKYGHLDADAQPGTPEGRLPSYLAALDYIKGLPDVQEALNAKIAEEGRAAFAPFVASGEHLDEEALTTLSGYSGKTLCLEAVRAALKTVGFTIRKNLIQGQIKVSGLPQKYSAEDALNTLPVLLKDILKGEPFKLKSVTDQALSGYLAALADENRYNPVQDMLKETQWDGADRLSEVFSILGLENPFDAMLVRKWMIQCVALALNDERDPIGADGVLVLQGPQGLGKTLFFRKVAVHPAWFIEGLSLDVGVKDSLIKSTSGWIVELGELDSTTRREQSALKAHITATIDAIRLPYARAETRRVRRTSFCGTVNPSEFLTDTTGNRRFWVISTSNIDSDRLLSLEPEWFAQLWAQVYRLWDADHDSFRLTRTERDKLMERNRRFETPLPGEDEIRRMLEDGLANIPPQCWQPYSASDIRNRLLLSGGPALTSQQAGRALSRISQDYPEMQQTGNSHKKRTYNLPIPKS